MEEERFQELQDAFQAYDKRNPMVWERFCAHVKSLLIRGCRHYSHDTIISVIRFERDVEIGPNEKPFKIPNEFKAFYGRKWMNEYGRYQPGFFRFCRMTGEPEWPDYYTKQDKG